MSSNISLYWDLLSYIGKLPDELIVKILYEYNGLKHPIVNLLNKTSYNYLLNLDRSKKIIENIKCKCGKYFINDFGNLNYLDIQINKHGNYVEVLNDIERHYNINHWICNNCYNIAFNEWKPGIINFN